MTLSRKARITSVTLALAGLVVALAWLFLVPLVSPDRSCKTLQRQADAFEAARLRRASGGGLSRDDEHATTEQIGARLATAFEKCADGPGAMVRGVGERELRSWGAERDAPK